VAAQQEAANDMNLRSSDFLLTRFAQGLRPVLKLLGDAETDLLGERLERVQLDRPVFIAGLARSGSTILLNLFSSLPSVGTHRYRDFPFVFVPYAWNQFQERMAQQEEPVERPHKDRILITRDSADAFEEPLWMHFFPFVHDAEASHELKAANEDVQFDKFYQEHLRKILLVRDKRRYVSKGNYNVARLEYLGNLFPDARFVIPIRHPLTHVDSLVGQHRLFTKYSAEDARVPEYMRAAGHYEFGPQRVPVNLDEISARRISEAWSQGADALGYAVMWHSVYSHVDRLRRGPLGGRITVVRYEDLCGDPAAVLSDLFRFCELTDDADALLGALPEISSPGSTPRNLEEADCAEVWRETRETAQAFGYRWPTPARHPA
jgi:hypothetical protein